MFNKIKDKQELNILNNYELFYNTLFLLLHSNSDKDIWAEYIAYLTELEIRLKDWLQE